MRKEFCILMLVLGSVLCTACGSEAKATNIEDTNTKKVTEASTEIDAFGRIEAIDKKTVYIGFPAYVDEIYVEEGNTVSKGDKLMSIDYTSFQTDIEVTQKQMEQDKLSLDSGIKGVGALNKQVKQLSKNKAIKESYLNKDASLTLEAYEDKLKSINSNIEAKQKEYEVAKQLVDIESASEKDLENIEVELKKLESDKSEIERAIVTFKDSTSMEINDLEASIAVSKESASETSTQNQRVKNQKLLTEDIAKLNVADKQHKLDYDYIKGNDIVLDINKGIIDKIECVEDSYIGVNDPTCCMTILDADSIQVVADVPEEFVKNVAVGQSCDIIPYYDNTKTIQGKVQRISDMAVKQDGETVVKVYIDIVDKDAMIKPGFNVDVKIKADKK